MADDRALLSFMRTIAASGGGPSASRSLAADPGLARAALRAGATRSTTEDFFFADHGMYVYAGDTALHVAAFTYDVPVARALVAAGADVRARNRRRAEPLHAAANGGPGSVTWDPPRQAEMVAFLAAAGARGASGGSRTLTPEGTGT